jgi:cysteine-rich repeat protein
LIAIAHAPAAAQTVVYTENFEAAAGAEWTTVPFDPDNPDGVPPVEVTPSGRRFLGRFGQAPFPAPPRPWAMLTLNGLPAHDIVRVSFDLYVIGSWDGESTLNGPDAFLVQGGAFAATFSNHAPDESFGAGEQSFPAPGSDAQTGAAEVGTLGYPVVGEAAVGDTVYHLTAGFSHTGAGVDVLFEGVGLQALDDESWGLDNVVVSVATGPNVPGGSCEGAWPAGTVSSGSLSFLTKGASPAGDPGVSCGCAMQGDSFWVAFEAGAAGRLTVDTIGSTHDRALAAYAGPCADTSELACDDSSAGLQQAAVSFLVQAGASYLLQATACGNEGQPGSLLLNFSLCGDGVVSGAEECDDGNAVSGDGCESDCALSVSNVQVICRPLAPEQSDQLGVTSKRGRHCYFAARDALGQKTTYSAFPRRGLLTPGKNFGHDLNDHNACGSFSPLDSVCLVVSAPAGHSLQSIVAHLEQAVVAGPEGTYEPITNNSNTWVKRRIDELGLDIILPEGAVFDEVTLGIHLQCTS